MIPLILALFDRSINNPIVSIYIGASSLTDIVRNINITNIKCLLDSMAYNVIKIIKIKKQFSCISYSAPQEVTGYTIYNRIIPSVSFLLKLKCFESNIIGNTGRASIRASIKSTFTGCLNK